MEGMGKAMMEDGDRDMGKSQTIEGSIGGLGGGGRRNMEGQ